MPWKGPRREPAPRATAAAVSAAREDSGLSLDSRREERDGGAKMIATGTQTEGAMANEAISKANMEPPGEPI